MGGEEGRRKGVGGGALSLAQGCVCGRVGGWGEGGGAGGSE